MMKNSKRVYATGRRKRSIARVWAEPGTGKVTVNGADLLTYFKRDVLKMVIEQPVDQCGLKDKLDVFATVVGGGLSGQAGALRLGISRCMVQMDEELRKTLRAGGFLTRDARIVERKKYGQPGARKRFQFSKR
ncbi:MAG: 30S ribosomal protein S9 [Calditrichaeota bacterium]|nr:30S ribosomal protein S9 [Candidatus Cloacimonadota bacterium]MCB1047149.1 30S ribosomal protein S9 [Calditrichota bacterium]MCB9472794.1 30S ribosomal protein S9 [Candidatus Delongbacteria bacterium]